MSRDSDIGLRDFGYIEGKNILLSIATLREKAIVTQALWPNSCQLKVDVLVVGGPGGLSAAKQATKTIPIVHRDTG